MNYFDLTVTAARRTAARLAEETHWIDYDVPTTRQRAQAACGSVVETRRFSIEPTCLACRQQKAIDDARTF